MHFSIPDTVQDTDENGTYWNFRLHVNGVYHCKLRYSQFDRFSDQLRTEFPDRTPMKIFPGKKMFSLSAEQLERRREGLESFIQHISQDPVISSSETFNEFFLNAQRDGWDEPHDVKLDVYLMNGNKVNVGVSSNDQTDDVFVIVTKQIGLSEKFFHYFALYLVVQQDTGGDIKIVRRLQEFESPYLSLQAVEKPHKIVIRKNYCSEKYDEDLMVERVAMNLLYVQIADDLLRGWMMCDEKVKLVLNKLQAENSRKEFLRVASKCKFYGFTHFSVCVGDYPEKDSKILVSCGDREFNIRVRTSDDKLHEGSFRVQRIRSWRLTSVPYAEGSEVANKETLYFAFEYLFGKDDLRWITIQSDQAIMMSMALQSMVDEIIREQEGKGIPKYSGSERKCGGGGGGENSVKTTTNKETPKTKPEEAVSTKPFAQGTKSKAFKWTKEKKEEVSNSVFANNIGDDDL